MDFAWFLYTVAIIVVAVMACSTSMTVWVLTNRKDALVAAAAFLVYTLETATILFDEYQRTKPYMEEYFTTGLTHPAVNVALCVALVACIWAWIILRVHASAQKGTALAALALFAAALVAVAPVGHTAGVARTMAYWALRDLAIIAALVFAWWWRNTKASGTDRTSIDRSKGFFKLALLLCALMLAEDVANILFVRPDAQTGWVRDFFWHLTERNLSENALMIACAVRMVLYNRDIMQIFSQHPMESPAAAGQVGGHRDFESRRLSFADAHGMSDRERDVLSLLLQGKSTQNVASELFISTGTVKAHTHRIYRKSGVESRQELVNAFWKH